MYKEYIYGSWKKEIRTLLRKRISLKERIWHHKNKIKYHLEKIKIIENEKLVDVEKNLEDYLKRTEIKIEEKV